MAPLRHEHFELAPLGLASRLLRATILALFSRMAAISFRFWLILLSRVTISHPLAA